MQKQFKRIRLILAVAVMAGLTVGGTWTANQFFYKPSLGASGTQEKTTYDTGLDRVDARLGKEIWIGDPAYGSTLASAVTAIGGNQVILRVPAGTATISTDLTVPANITLQLQRGAVLSVADGKTLTINGEIRAGAYQIFAWTGAGAIRLSNALKEVLVDWFIPAGATDHTAYIKKAVDSGNHLVGSGVYARPPVVLTRESYVIANLNFDMGATGLPNYCGLTLSGKPGGGNNGSVKLTVNGANDNGILITGNFTAGGAFANYITLENLQIIKASYPGDARSDYGLKLRRSQWIRLRNVKIKNFGESALFIQDCFFGSFEGFEAETCYRAINLTASTMDPYWACTTMHFVNPSLMGCKILVYNSGGRAHATFSGLTADDFGGFTSTAYVDVSHQTVQLYFDRCWLEGLNAASYGVNFRDGAMYPRYNHITFTDCQLHLKNPSYLVGASGSGTGVISLKMSSISYTDSGDSVLYKDRTVIPNRTDSHACTEVAGLGKADLEGPAIFMSTPTASGTMVTEGPNGVAVGTKGVSSFGGVVNHRYYDDGIVGLSQEYKNDGFISTIGGLITPSLFLRQYYLYGLRLAVASAIPANQTC
ncbi:MAG: hypothetical protein FJ128_12625, partial [Deltaproteobacteria bacterium]|nr:hypothetical protein [Deltaproteobacteria bacterium]